MLDLTPKRLKLFLQLAEPGDGGGDFGGGGGGGGSGGGTPGTPSTGTSGLPATENGGVSAREYVLLVPVQDPRSGLGYLAFYDFDDFNDPDDGCFYTYRVEEIDMHSVPTVRRVAINYVDLGPLTLTVRLGATNDNNESQVVSTTVKLGTPAATASLLTAFVDISITGFQPQLQLVRDAGAGPMCIVAVTIYGEVEQVSI